MSGSICKVILIGNVVRDPAIKETATKKKVATFSVAVNRNKDEADFHNVVAWEQLATVVESYVQKGKKVYIEGRLQNRTYEKDGVKRYMTEIVATEMVLLGGKPADASGDATTPTESVPAAPATPAPIDDIDF
jgi:single-strand DNA-binding protein